MLGYGALFLGHSRKEIVQAVSQQVANGTNMGSSTPQELRWAEIVCRLIPSIDKVRFAASGTEANMLALRVARAYTGKTKIIKFREHFHGWNDFIAPESGINTKFGIPEEILSTTIVVNPDLEQLESVLKKTDDIAAIIVEPTGGHWGELPLNNPGFLQGLRKLTSQYGILMIMDEVITGFRISRGGAQEKFNIDPDLTIMAKIVSGGLPGGALGGKAELMELIGSDQNEEYIAHPGTWNGNPLSAAAGIAALTIIEKDPINAMANSAATELKQGINYILKKLEVPGIAHGVSSIVHVALGIPLTNEQDIYTITHDTLQQAKDPDRVKALKLAMLVNGVDMMGGIGFMVSPVHTKNHIEKTLDAFEKSITAIQEEGLI